MKRPDFLACGLRNIERDRLLAPIGAQEISGLARVLALAIFKIRRTPTARVVADTRPLDLDHLRAEIGQDLPAPGTGEHAAHVQYTQV